MNPPPRLMKSISLKPAASYLVMQVIPVMIGIYLGFVVSNWGEQRKATRESKQLLQTILAEVELNQQQITAVIDYHRRLKDSCRHYLAHPLTGPPVFFEGTRTTSLLKSAYQSGLQTGLLSYLPLKKVQLLNQVYTLQDDYTTYGKNITSTLIAMDFDDDPRHIRKILQMLSMTMTDVVIQEEQLLELYHMLLNNL